MRRARGPGGRFLSKEEREALMRELEAKEAAGEDIGGGAGSDGEDDEEGDDDDGEDRRDGGRRGGHGRGGEDEEDGGGQQTKRRRGALPEVRLAPRPTQAYHMDGADAAARAVAQGGMAGQDAGGRA